MTFGVTGYNFIFFSIYLLYKQINNMYWESMNISNLKNMNLLYLINAWVETSVSYPRLGE